MLNKKTRQLIWNPKIIRKISKIKKNKYTTHMRLEKSRKNK